MQFPAVPAAYVLTDVLTNVFYIGSTGNLNARMNSHRSTLERGVHDNYNFQQVYSGWHNIQIEYYPRFTLDAARRQEESLLMFHSGDDLMANIGTGVYSVWGGGMPNEYRERNRITSRYHALKPENVARIQTINASRSRDETARNLERARLAKGLVSEITRQRMSDAWHASGGISPETRKKMTEANLRRSVHFSDEVRDRQRKACQRPVIIEGIHYQSVTDASDILGLGQSTISYRLKSSRFVDWIYHEENSV